MTQLNSYHSQSNKFQLGMTPNLSQPIATQNLRTTLVGAQPATSIPPNLSNQIIVLTKMQRRMGMESKRRQRQFFSLFMSYFSLFLVQLQSISCPNLVYFQSNFTLFFVCLLSNFCLFLVYFFAIYCPFQSIFGCLCLSESCWDLQILPLTFDLSFRKLTGP